MTEPTTLANRCDQCQHYDGLRGVHPVKCRSPAYQHSLPCQQARSESGKCGPGAVLWEPRGVRIGEASRADV